MSSTTTFHEELEETEEPNISALEYARATGLACNHLEEPLPLWHQDSTNNSNDSLDDAHLLQFNLKLPIKEERLTLSKEGGRLLAWVHSKEPLTGFDDPYIPRTRKELRRRALVELPLLRSRNDIDRMLFACRDGFEIQMQDIRLPEEMVEGEYGLELPPRLFNLGAEIIEVLKKEKLEVSKETISVLQTALKDEWTAEDEGDLWQSLIKHKKVLEPVTPPLSPLPNLYIPYQPAQCDPAFDIPLFSDPVSLTKDDLAELEAKIYAQDAPTLLLEPIFQGKNIDSDETLVESMNIDEDTVNTVVNASCNNSSATPSPLARKARVKLEQLKVEETLTPPKPTPLARSARFSEIINTVQIAPPFLISSPVSEPVDFKDFKALFGEAGERALRQSEQETLISADAIARVKEPLMDFSAPEPPWKSLQGILESGKLNALQSAFINTQITADMKPIWKQKNKHELKWNPFPHSLAKVALTENIEHGDDVWKVYVDPPADEPIITSATLTWKPPGLKILNDEDEDDDDDEIEPGTFRKEVKSRDMAFFVKKRKLRLEEQRADSTGASKDRFDSNIIFPINQPPGQKVLAPSAIASAAQAPAFETNLGGILGENFSTGVALDNFLEIRGTKKLKLTDSSYFANTSIEPVIAEKVPTPPLPVMQIPIRNSPIPGVPLPVPEVAQPTNINVVVSTNLVKNRSLLRFIERQLPGVRMVERDFAAHNTTIWMPNSVTRSPIPSALASEADIIVSASTGIILTTLQKIKQRPLPGQKTKTAIRERVEKVGLRYEKLIVLVSENSSSEATHSMDSSDCDAFGEFVGFASGLHCAVVVQFVGGGEETLAKWIASNITQSYAPCDLIEDETHWEVFLRRAGMNAYAAQILIGELKAPAGVNAVSSSKAGMFGLTAFVEMGGERRMSMFGHIFGLKVLERVNSAIDAKWQ